MFLVRWSRAPTGVSGQYLYFNFTNVLPGPHSFVINVTVDPGLPPGTFLINWVFLNYTDASGIIRPESMDNATTVVTDVAILVVKVTGDVTANPGDTITYTIWFNNTGTAASGDVWINDTLPIGVTYQSDTSATSPTSFPFLVSSGISGQYLYFNFTNVIQGPHSFTIDVIVEDGVP